MNEGSPTLHIEGATATLTLCRPSLRNSLTDDDLLTLLRHTTTADAEVRRGEWHREANRGEELGTKTVGLLGYGHMGRAFARRLRGFGCTVLAHDHDGTPLVTLPEGLSRQVSYSTRHWNHRLRRLPSTA